jgi:ribonuclease P protein component
MMSPVKQNSFPAFERIKSRKLFDMLFVSGSILKQYPVRLVWMAIPFHSSHPVQIAVSVPKRYMHDAVDRNRMKRLVRESYRLNKHSLVSMAKEEEKGLALLFIVQSKTPLSFSETQEKIILLLQRLILLHVKTAE